MHFWMVCMSCQHPNEHEHCISCLQTNRIPGEESGYTLGKPVRSIGFGGTRGPEVWSPAGLEILGTPVVSDARLRGSLLVRCAGKRCHRLLRTMPPSRSAEFAQGHDAGVQQTITSLLEGLPGTPHQHHVASQVASLPIHLEGLELISAAWASWADALPMKNGSPQSHITSPQHCQATMQPQVVWASSK